MNERTMLHHMAMDACGQADKLGDPATKRSALVLALGLEMQAVAKIVEECNTARVRGELSPAALELTCKVMYRSAASIAAQLGFDQIAESLASKGIRRESNAPGADGVDEELYNYVAGSPVHSLKAALVGGRVERKAVFHGGPGDEFGDAPPSGGFHGGPGDEEGW